MSTKSILKQLDVDQSDVLYCTDNSLSFLCLTNKAFYLCPSKKAKFVDAIQLSLLKSITLKAVPDYKDVFHLEFVYRKSMYFEDANDLRFLLQRYSHNECERLSLSTITGKIKLIEALLFWSESAEEKDAYDDYLISVKRLFECVDIAGLWGTLDDLKQWLKYRNEVIHASMNKNIDVLYEGLLDQVEMGMEYARVLDNYVKTIKKDNRVRKKLHMSQR